MSIEQELKKSKFRSSFKLDFKDLEYIQQKGLEKIEQHCKDFVIKRLAPKKIANDGKQTPFKGHPVFKAQHATATCCRSCLQKWHKIPKDKDLNGSEIDYIVKFLIDWIKSNN